MTHLSPSEFVDAIDDVLSPAATAHLGSCGACERELAVLRGTLSEARGVELPEPSPLFWHHFEARVREATASVPVVGPSWWTPIWRPLAAIGVTGLALTLAVFLARPQSSAPAASEIVASTAADAGPDPMDLDHVNTDQVEVIAALAGKWSWDEIQASSLAPSRGALDFAMMQLTDAQRDEAIRLLREIKGLE